MLKGRETRSFNLVRFRARQILLKEMLDEIGKHEQARAAENLELETQLQFHSDEMALDVMAANHCILALGAPLQ